MEATATQIADPSRYSVRALSSGKLAVIDHEGRGRVALIGSDEEVYDFLADYDAYLSEPSVEEEERAYSRMLEDRAAHGSWFGGSSFDDDDAYWGSMMQARERDEDRRVAEYKMARDAF